MVSWWVGGWMGGWVGGWQSSIGHPILAHRPGQLTPRGSHSPRECCLHLWLLPASGGDSSQPDFDVVSFPCALRPSYSLASSFAFAFISFSFAFALLGGFDLASTPELLSHTRPPGSTGSPSSPVLPLLSPKVATEASPGLLVVFVWRPLCPTFCRNRCCPLCLAGGELSATTSALVC